MADPSDPMNVDAYRAIYTIFLQKQTYDKAWCTASVLVFMKKATEEEQRVIIDEMLQVFYDDGPWLHMYFQPDFYGVSNRIVWEPRRDEYVELFEAALRLHGSRHI